MLDIFLCFREALMWIDTREKMLFSSLQGLGLDVGVGFD